MSEFDALYKKLMTEMARTASILKHSPSLNSAYAKALQIMRANGETNAPTFAIWDYIWKCLPDKIKTEELINKKRKTSSPTLKFFIISILKNQLTPEIENQLISDLMNESKIKSYLLRPLSARGSRAKGKARNLGVDYHPETRKLNP